MKSLLILILLCTFSNTYAQEWTEQEMKIVEEFSLDIRDHRGVIFHSGEEVCGETYESIEAAIVDFFMKTVKRDITEICVSNLDISLEGATLDLRELIRLYINNQN